MKELLEPIKIAILSDTHCKHGAFSVPECDVLIHAGDITEFGEASAMIRFIDWLADQPAEYKVFIAGNHDFCMEGPSKEKVLNYIKDCYPFRNIIYLQDSEVTIKGYKIYGSPWQPRFYDYAFNVDRGKLHEHWKKIPDDVDILVTHGPPDGILDKNYSNIPCGCKELRDELSRLTGLKLHIFGHIHDSRGIFDNGNTIFVNACVDNLSIDKEALIIEF